MTKKEVMDVSFHDYLKDETQKERGVLNYLEMTYENIKDHVFLFDNEGFDSQRDFFEFLSDLCREKVRMIDNEDK